MSDEVAVVSGRVTRRRRAGAGGEGRHVRADRRRRPRRPRRHRALQELLTRSGGACDRRVAITGHRRGHAGRQRRRSRPGRRCRRAQRRRADHDVRRRRPSRCRSPGMVKGFDLRARLPDPRTRAPPLARRAASASRRRSRRSRTPSVGPGTTSPRSAASRWARSVGRPEPAGARRHVARDRTRATATSCARQAPSQRRSCATRTCGRGDRAARRVRRPDDQRQHRLHRVAHALGEAFRRIQEGDAKLMLAGGYDALTTWLDVLGFSPARRADDGVRRRAGARVAAVRQGALGLRARRGRRRRGPRGAGSPRVARGARILRRARRLRLEHERLPDDRPAAGRRRRDAARCASALDDAGLAPDEVDYVVAHGTSTPGNDMSRDASRSSGCSATTRYKLAVTSPKSMTGHLTCAAGGAQRARRRRCAIRDGVVPPTINYDTPTRSSTSTTCRTRRADARCDAVLVNSFAFGGTNGVPRAAPLRGRPTMSQLGDPRPDRQRRARRGARARSATSRTRSRSSTATSRASRSLPGVLILGSLGALGAKLLEEETGRRWRLAGGGAGRLPPLRAARRPDGAHGRAEGARRTTRRR